MSIITKAELINKKTGEIKELFYRTENKRCSFLEEFPFGQFCITLRLDWAESDDVYCEPILDADIFTLNARTGKKKKYKKDKDEWHHTTIEKIPGEKLFYKFTFKDLELIFERRITVSTFLDGKIKIVNNSSKSV